ncbi:MAG TPA: phosphoenolpyruvate carboxykinase [Anaerolineae bacterium]|nr:phosphoenolpyruvate carboxykinase [Anaerolineae bacterium]
MIQSKNRLNLTGLNPSGTVYWNLAPAQLVEHAVCRAEGIVTRDGPLNAITTPHTGRSPGDKFTVREPSSENDIWWGKHNQALSPEQFERLYQKLSAYLSQRDALFVRDVCAGADPAYRLNVRVVNENAWHNLFAHNLFIRPDPAELVDFLPDFTIMHAPGCKADPALDGTKSETFIALNFARQLILIGGTNYAGEMKKSIFSALNYLLPMRAERVFPMHCSANVDQHGDTALFFGLSGTGKTTLSADPDRDLIGDDEHGWSDRGIFNFEGGCYAKVIRLSPEAEPEIYATTRRFGTVLENVVVDPETRTLNLDDQSITENTRAAYPLTFVDKAVIPGVGGHPKNVVFLTADAFGVLPPVSKLTPEQAMYHFLSGYTAKVAGTERGVTEPQATFSTCFAAPFLPRQPTVYARLLGEKLAQRGAQVWLVNTGWSGGPYGVGARMKIAYTRAMVHAALNGVLDKARTEVDPIFGLHIPIECPGVPDRVLNPRNTWADPEAYDQKARELAALFVKNFAQYESQVAHEVRAAAPKPYA